MEPVQLGAAQQQRGASPSARSKLSSLANPAVLFGRSQVSLRFVSPLVEDAFCKSRVERLRGGVLASVGCLIIVNALYLISLQFNYEQEDGLRYVPCLLSLSVSLGAGVVSILPWTRARMSHRSYECIGVLIAFSALTFSFGRMGLNERAQGHAIIAAGWTMTIVASVATLTHTLLSARWCVMVFVDIVSCAIFFVQHPTNIAIKELGMLIVGILASGSAGMYMLEDAQRSLFAALLDQKKLRAQAEFRANPSLPKGPEHAPQGDHRSCGASTTETGEVFLQGTHSSSSLTDLVSMGAKEQWLVGDHEVTVMENEVLGRGGFGVTVAGQMSRSDVAIKVYRKGICGELDGTVMNELRILRHLRHPNIVLFHGALIDVSSGNVSIVMERVFGMSYASCVAQMNSWTPQSTCHAGQMRVLRLVAEALCHLHTRRPAVVHADLKPGNILIETRAEGPFPKLLDFGLASISRRRSVAGGTPGWAAPELCQSKGAPPATPAMDIYSFGLLVFFTASGGEAVTRDQQRSAEQLQQVLDSSQRKSRLLGKWRPTLRQCLSWSPSMRPTMLQVHDWLFLLDDSAEARPVVPWAFAFQGKSDNLRSASKEPALPPPASVSL